MYYFLCLCHVDLSQTKCEKNKVMRELGWKEAKCFLKSKEDL